LFGGLFSNLKPNVTELSGETAAIGLKLLVVEELTHPDRQKLARKCVRMKYKGC
jgi:hypothetical protein